MRTVMTFILAAALTAGAMAAAFGSLLLPAIVWLVIGILVLMALTSFFILVRDLFQINKEGRISELIANLIVIIAAVALALMFYSSFLRDQIGH